MTPLLLLCLEFMYIGLFAIGGGLAAIQFLIELSEKHPEWYSISMLADIIAVSEATPGPIGVNMATFVGYTVAGLPGAVLATLSLALPAFIILLIISPVLKKYRSNVFVNASFKGLRPAVAGIIAAAGVAVLKMVLITEDGLDVRSLALFAAIFLCTQLPVLKKLHPVGYIGIAALVGVVVKI